MPASFERSFLSAIIDLLFQHPCLIVNISTMYLSKLCCGDKWNHSLEYLHRKCKPIIMAPTGLQTTVLRPWMESGLSPSWLFNASSDPCLAERTKLKKIFWLDLAEKLPGRDLSLDLFILLQMEQWFSIKEDLKTSNWDNKLTRKLRE